MTEPRAKISIIETNVKFLCKEYKADKFKPDGSLKPVVHAKLFDGSIETRELSLRKLKETIEGFTQKQALCLGTRKPEFTDISKVVRDEDVVKGKSIARSKDYLEFNENPAFMLFDYDDKELSPIELRTKFIEFMPEFKDVGMLIVPSSSAGVHLSSDAPPDIIKSGCHIYVMVSKGSQIPAIGALVKHRAWLAGLGYIKVSKSGALLERYIFDDAVYSPERLIFDAPPLLNSGVMQVGRKLELFDGGAITDLDTTLTESDREKQNELLTKAVEDARPKADETRAVWAKAKGKELKAKGLTPAKIKKVLEGRTTTHEKDGRKNLYFLSPDDEIKTELGTFQVSEIITNKAKFHRIECVDPDDVDDPQDYDKFRAIIGFYDDESVMMYSQASGGKIYVLKRKTPKLEPETVGLIDELNQRYAKVMRGGRCLIMEQATEIDDLTDLEKTVYVFHNPKEFMQLKSHELVTVGQNLKPKFKVWFDHPQCRTFDRVSFKPFYKNPPKLLPNEFNIYSGFAVEPVNHGLNYPYLQHLIKKLCDRNSEHEKWFYDWFAFCFQYPERKSEVAPVLRGDEGTGKGSIGAFWLSLWGNHGMATGQTSHVVGKFNGHLQYMKAVVGTEAFFAGDKQSNGALKMLISDYDLPVERKGFDVEPSKNYINLLMTTNEAWAVPAGATSRRYAVFDLNKVTGVDGLVIKDFEQRLDNLETIYYRVGDAFIDSSKGEDGKDWISKARLEGYVTPVGDFYTELTAELKSKEVKEQFLFDMLNRDIKGYLPNRNIPVTSALMEQRIHTLKDDTVATWLTELFIDGCEFTITRVEGSKEDPKITVFNSIEGIPSCDLYENYLQYCSRSKSSAFKQVGKIPFSRRLSTLGSKPCWVKSERGLSFDGFFSGQLFSKLGL